MRVMYNWPLRQLHVHMRVVYNVGSQFGLKQLDSETATFEDGVQCKISIMFKKTGL